ncbi:helix-turn-helix domain-containing protein [Nocardia sp. SC052]|uniref:helix-turn-helix domain-containing protein n=1 Tax=Nocardia sichangensis TaxID=3385975 RepID=UPI0039A1F948
MKDEDLTYVGGRIAHFRKLRKLTQHQLAAQAHVSRSMLADVERGKAKASTVWIGAVATALAVDASRLYGTNTEPEQLAEILPQLRRTLAATDLMSPDTVPGPVDQLERMVARVGVWRRETRYRDIAAALPDLVDQLLVIGSDQVPRSRPYTMLAELYRAANTVAHKLGYVDLSLTATERMEWAATRAGDPLLLATTHYVKAATLSRMGATDHALRLLSRAMADIDPLLEDDDQTVAAVYSLLHMRAGTIAAATGDADTARSHLEEAGRLAARFPDGVVYGTPVGPANVSLYQLCAEADLNEPGRALEIANRLNLPKGMAAERKAYGEVDRARAFLLAQKLDDAMDALERSYQASPEHFAASNAVKGTVTTVLAQQRRGTDRATRLAGLAGLDA